MFKTLWLSSLPATVLAALVAVVPAAKAQSAEPASSQTAAEQQAAPIVRSYPGSYPGSYPAGQLRRTRFLEQNQIVESQPVAGVWLRSESSSAVTTVSATAQRAEIRLERGRLNVSVHHPAEHAEILVDLPGGQVSLFKDGLYTFNADTNTVRVLRGEAAAYPGPIRTNADTKPIKIKEDHQLSLVAVAGSGKIKPVEAYPYEMAADLLPLGHGDGYADYGDGYSPYPYPYYYPGYFGYGYPFGYGIGFGYYGGFGGGFGYRGGFRR